MHKTLRLSGMSLSHPKHAKVITGSIVLEWAARQELDMYAPI
jgi:hypothetical protein